MGTIFATRRLALLGCWGALASTQGCSTSMESASAVGGGAPVAGAAGTPGSSTGGTATAPTGGSAGTQAAATGGTTTTGGAPAGNGGASPGGAGISGSGTGGSGTSGGGSSSGGASAGGSAGNAVAGAGASGSPQGGSAGAGTGGAAGGAGGKPDLVWPNETSKANSDSWLVENHDRIARLEPKVLVINLESVAESQATTLVDRHIAALEEASSFHKYKDDSAEPALAYKLLKIVSATKGGGSIDYNSWNTQGFADSNLQIKDPADPSGPNLTLCQLFERGVVNEVWCMASSNPKCGETQEAKQVYQEDGTKVASMFRNVSNGDNINGLGCDVTVRITDFNNGRGAGCHQHAMAHAWERYMDTGAVPMLGKQARRFLNWDLDDRVGAPFSNFYSACNSNGTQLTDCLVWDSQIAVSSGPSASQNFSIDDMSEGCGNGHFYPNTTGTYSYDANQPDPTVLTSCENYGMKNGPDGKDLTTTYNNAMTDDFYGQSRQSCPADQPACDDDCGGHGTTYLYQNFPGPGTAATNDDGTPMQNWWVYLFY